MLSWDIQGTLMLCLPCRVNVSLGPREDRMLITGLHTVADIFCTVCNTNLGWKYEMAFEEAQKYKVRPLCAVVRVRG